MKAHLTCTEGFALCLLVDDAAHDAGDDLLDVTDDGDLDQSHTDPDPADDSEEAEGGKELSEDIKTEKLKVTDENRTQDGEIKDNKLVDCLHRQRDTVKESEKYAVVKLAMNARPVTNITRLVLKLSLLVKVIQ